MSVSTHFHVVHDTQGKQYVLNSHLELIGHIMLFMNAAIYGKETFRKTFTTRLGINKTQISELGEHLTRLESYANTYSNLYQYHPLLQFFFDEYANHVIKDCSCLHGNDQLRDGRFVFEVFDDFIAVLRSRALIIKLKKKVHDWESVIQKQKNTLMRLERAAFAACSRIAVIRLDFFYHAAQLHTREIESLIHAGKQYKRTDIERLTDIEEESSASLIKGRVTFEQLQRDRTHFFANMKGKTSLFKHLLGYAWCIEFTPGAGYHMHLVFLFNGSKIEKHAWLAQQIGEYWKTSITKGRGYFENCNMKWDETSPTYGLGIIEETDARKRKNLRQVVLSYLTKPGQLVLMLPYKGCNRYGSCLLHRNRAKGRGRPRGRGTDQRSLSKAPISRIDEPIDFQGLFTSSVSR
jgi:hypothetical protein